MPAKLPRNALGWITSADGQTTVNSVPSVASMAEDAAYQEDSPFEDVQPTPADLPSVEGFKYFLALPAEIRVKIYDLVLWIPEGVYPEFLSMERVDKVYFDSLFDKRIRPDLGLLFVNKQVAVEAAARFYSINTFHFDAVAVFLFENIFAEYKCEWIGRNALHVRQLEYKIAITDSRNVHRYDSPLAKLCPLLPNLQSIVIRYEPYNRLDRFFQIGSRVEDLRKLMSTVFQNVEDVQLVADPGRPIF
ncbi:hypothetical protein VTJ49DRAFT_939 [Mycothermus thermophilus]|uniref:Uncharacterized protein n=1 Tax=Humicola insolens TaxID=85995 RepID=A0ABR3VDY4_HUMIN